MLQAAFVLIALTGNCNLDARMYDPGIGRFNSFDPYPDSLNKYAYCHNDPVNFADPTGRFEGLIGMMTAISVSLSINTNYNARVVRQGIPIINELLTASATMNGIWGQPKHNSTATFITHGVAGPLVFDKSAGWSQEYQDAYVAAGLDNTDFIEYTWSGFEINGYGVIPVERTHNLAVAFQVNAMNVVMAKGYDSINMIAHSWGTAITYDAIERSGLYIKNWVTMGSPLRADTPRPSVGHWIDFYSNCDPVTWLNAFPPFPQIDLGSLNGFVYSLIPLAGNVTWWESAERVSADVSRDTTGRMIAQDTSLREHTAYWLNSYVIDTFVPYLR